jgi:hypothetical protein
MLLISTSNTFKVETLLTPNHPHLYIIATPSLLLVRNLFQLVLSKIPKADISLEGK